jgi:hypothetical protein
MQTFAVGKQTERKFSAPQCCQLSSSRADLKISPKIDLWKSIEAEN